MRLAEVVETSGAVAATRARSEKVARLAACLRRAAPDEIAPVVAWLAGAPRQGRLGLGPIALRDVRPPPAPSPGLRVAEVDRALAAIAETRGAGAHGEKRRRLEALLARATPTEQDFLRRLVAGSLRQGALEGLLADAVAEAADVPPALVRRAWMLAGDLPEVARAALEGGREALAGVRLEVLRPVRPMLATPAARPEDALERLGEAALEWKLDGARVQVHRDGGEVAVFTRSLEDVTASVPELVEAARALPARRFVLDGEALALRADGRPLPFQVTMRRFGRRADVARLRAELPLTALFFDLLVLDDEELLDRPGAERFAALEDLVPATSRVPRRVTGRADEARAFLEEALRRGHEGLMAKSLAAPYEAGRRGAAWRKVKPAHTLDLVVLAAEWGSGRRRGRLSNLHLGARDPQSRGFVMLGKTFKGMTDAMLAWQTAKLLELETAREGHVVWVRPELVVEVAFDGTQESPRYPAGLALRFARIVRHRPDKGPAEADTIEAVRAIHERARSG